jgi:hypothetical protein
MRLPAVCWIVLCTLALRAQEITDLGVVSPHRAITLVKDTNQVDFLHFKIDLVALRWPSNSVTFTTTNDMLTLDQFMPMPPGPCIVGVRSVYSDGDESNISLYRVRVRRDPPKAPQAHGTGILHTNLINRQSTTNLLHERFRSRTNQQSAALPPLPGGLVMLQTRGSPLIARPSAASDLSRETVRTMAEAEESVRELTNHTVMAATVAFPGPLPGGESKTYSDHMVEMHDFHTRQGKSPQ